MRPDIDVADLLRLSHAVVAATERVPDRAAAANRLLEIMLGGVLRPGDQASGGQASGGQASGDRRPAGE